MRIISRGVAPSEREYQHTCRYCGTVFAFYMNSVTRRDDQREGSWYEITCPHEPCSKVNATTALTPVNTRPPSNNNFWDR